MFLLDTVVLSELRKRQRDPAVVMWIAAQRSADLFVSVISIGEIERGIALQQTKDPRFAEALGLWLDRVIALYGDRILPFDLNVARRWGRLSAAIGNDSADLMIAATALEHGLTVVTRNVSDFAPTDARTLVGAGEHREARARLRPAQGGGRRHAADDAIEPVHPASALAEGGETATRLRRPGRCRHLVLDRPDSADQVGFGAVLDGLAVIAHPQGAGRVRFPEAVQFRLRPGHRRASPYRRCSQFRGRPPSQRDGIARRPGPGSARIV